MQKLTIDDVRPEVITFAIKMERKLRENDHKGGWLNDYYDYLITRLEDEVEELKIAYKKGNGVLTGIASECCDIANYAIRDTKTAGADGIIEPGCVDRWGIGWRGCRLQTPIGPGSG